jgi:hypothetical protein
MDFENPETWVAYVSCIIPFTKTIRIGVSNRRGVPGNAGGPDDGASYPKLVD